MGIHDERAITFEPDRFSFLKLHGGIGQFNRTRDCGMNHIYWPKFGTKRPEFNDEHYLRGRDTREMSRESPFHPTKS
jgi:hypothetical protein